MRKKCKKKKKGFTLLQTKYTKNTYDVVEPWIDLFIVTKAPGKNNMYFLGWMLEIGMSAFNTGMLLLCKDDSYQFGLIHALQFNI